MKTPTVLILIISLLLSGCTIPCDIYFRNLTNGLVKLQASLVDRWRFNKLPNKVNYYEIPGNTKDIIGKWQRKELVTWVDSTTFYIEVPSNTAIDVSDISNGLVLGTKSPDILLTAIHQNIIDTLTTGDYISVANRFKSKNKLFSKPVYFYDLQ